MYINICSTFAPITLLHGGYINFTRSSIYYRNKLVQISVVLLINFDLAMAKQETTAYVNWEKRLDSIGCQITIFYTAGFFSYGNT